MMEEENDFIFPLESKQNHMALYYWQKPSEEELAQLAHEKASFKEHLFLYCPICGRISWHVSHKGVDRKITIGEDDKICGKCEEIMRRAPEIFYWVQRAIRQGTTPKEPG
jgi:hypothetical protein